MFNLPCCLQLDEEDAEDSSDDDEFAKPKKYVPPKVVAMHYGKSML